MENTIILSVIIIFILGYIAITLEHPIKVDKLIPALIMTGISWMLIAINLNSITAWFDPSTHNIVDGFGKLSIDMKKTILKSTFSYHTTKTAEILFFLIGAMTIVEIIDYFNGFEIIKSAIKTRKKIKLLWIVCILAFILAAIIDNLTTTIVLIVVLRKFIVENKDRIWFVGLVIIAANAGGVWSPIGNITTTMLWTGDKVTMLALFKNLFAPSVVAMLVPAFIASFLPAFKGTFNPATNERESTKIGSLMLIIGLLAILFVPIFKTLTGLPPWVGMMFSLGFVSLIAETIGDRKFPLTVIKSDESIHKDRPTFRALSKIEIPSILFFLGILMTIAALESITVIFDFGNMVNASMDSHVFVIILGGLSAIVDNIPLVAASMGMFDPSIHMIDSSIWHFIAYSAGTGGSMLIIGSAAGVIGMGMEKIPFFWYIKHISLLAMAGFIAGAVVYLLWFM